MKHKVQKGDTLWHLASKHRTTPKEIAKANGISENATLAIGKYIKIPSRYTPARPARAANVTRQASYSLHTKVDSACLRTGPSTESSRIATLPAGTTVKLLSTRGSWRKVALANGVCGFVYAPLLAPGAGSTQKPADMTVDNDPNTVPPSPERNSELIQTALSCRGARYARGGTSRGGFDCSGFTRYVFARYGVSLPHSSAAQARLGTPVSRGELAAGDLVFFQTYRSGISHVGIYIGDGKFVHAATRGRGVRVDSLGDSYYAPRYRGARRVK